MNLFDLTPEKIKKMSIKDLKELAEEIRSFLIENIPITGGHLASNLGIIELTIALHYVFNSPTDQLIFDVGHQTYSHKIITGRANEFYSLRKKSGLSGYPNYQESIHDSWESGHAGNSISALMGVLTAKRLKNEPGKGIAIIGDASISNGMAFEALNHLATDQKHHGIIILNDNKMGISKNVGGFSRMLSKLRGTKGFRKTKKGLNKVLPGFLRRFFSRVKRSLKGFLQAKNIFEDMGYMYLGPIDGHSIKGLIESLNIARKSSRSVVLHVVTKKGKGHDKAETDELGEYHGIVSSQELASYSYSDVISQTITDLNEIKPIYVVMPAMTIGSKFGAFSLKFPEQFVDVGIAEEHAATMAAALSKEKIDVFLPFYSTFSQRAFDQILNDIARPNFKVIIGIDRAGIVGEDGSTHQGLFDVAMFNLMPNIKIAAPSTPNETRDLINYAFNQKNPMVIRVPKIPVDNLGSNFREIGEDWETIKAGKLLTVVSFGPIIWELLREISHIDVSIINARFIKPLDYKTLDLIASSNLPIIIYEETTSIGGLSSEIIKYFNLKRYNNEIHVMSITNIIVEHGSRDLLLQELKMSVSDIITLINKILVK